MSSDIAAGVIHRLREVLAELEQDRKRLDFLEQNKIEWVGIRHGLETKRFASLREAIDNSIEVKAINEEWEARDYRARMEGMSRG